MSKLIASINMTLDGFCDHTAVIPDPGLHHHFAALLEEAGVLLYGRITYQLMEYWRTVVDHPTGDEAMDQFAVIMDRTPKLVFSTTLENVSWHSARLATQDLKTEVESLKQQSGKPIMVGSPSLIIQLLNLHLVDEFQLVIHPVIHGSGKPLFRAIAERTMLRLIHSKTLGSGAMVMYYEPEK